MRKGILLSVVALSLSCAAMGQKTETIVLKKEHSGQTVIELKDGKILVDGRQVSTYPKGKNDVAKRIVIDGVNDAPNDMDWPVAPYLTPNKAMLGVVTQDDGQQGALIKDVKAGSAADQAGLQPGDRILAIDATGISDGEALVSAIGKKQEGDKVEVRYERQGKTNTATAVLQGNTAMQAPFSGDKLRDGNQMPGSMPFDLGQMPQLSPEDVEGLQQLFEQFQMPATGPKLGIAIEENANGSGLLIKSVTPGSAAEKAGLRAGDILTHWNGNVISNTTTLQQQVQGARLGKPIAVSFQRNGKVNNTEVVLSEPKKQTQL